MWDENKKISMKLSQKLTLFFICILIIYGSLLGTSFYRYAKNYVIDENTRSNLQTVKNVRDFYLQTMLNDVSKEITYWSEYTGLNRYNQPDDMVQNTYDTWKSEWRSYIALNRNSSCIYIGSETDGSLLSIPLDLSLPDIYDARERTWYEGAIEDSHKVFWSMPYHDIRQNGDFVFTVSRAVIRNGDCIGVIGMDIKLKTLSKVLTDAYTNQQGNLVVIDEKGHIYAHSDENKLATTLKSQGWTQIALSRTEGSGLLKEDGQEYIYSFVTIKETGWKLIGFRKLDYSTLYKNITVMILYSFVMLILVIIFAGFFSKQLLLKPLKRLMKTIQSVSKGDLSARNSLVASMYQNDEIGEISVSFNRMLDRINEINTELSESLKLSKEGCFETVFALANAIEANDEYTRGHCRRVCKYALMMGQEVGLSHQEMRDLEYASVLHDIGKIGIPNEIINKQGRLSDEEYRIIQNHPVIGAEILEGVSFLSECQTILLQHHERIDGKGYPLGLYSEEINIAAKILAIADSYDAMTSNRPYRKSAFSVEEAICELERGSGTQFDSDLITRFIEIIKLE